MAEPSGSEESENVPVVVVSENLESATTNSGKSPKKKTSAHQIIASTGVNGTRKTCKETGECIAGTGIQGDFNLTNSEDGLLPSAFMVGLLVASPIFPFLAKTCNKPFKLIGVGLLIWTIATACCGVTSRFWNIALCRMLVGVGEASFMSLASPFIDDNAPPAKKAFWIALFYMCIPVGIAVGYIYGGFVASHLNWRAAFFGEAILMLPFVLLCFFMEPLPLKGFASSEATLTQTVGLELHEIKITEVSDQGKNIVEVSSTEGQSNNKTSRKTYLSKRTINQISRFLKDLKVLLLDKVYIVSVSGYVAYTFVIGAYSYWGPKAGADIYHMTNSDIFFGVITSVCGVCGTLAGGHLLDRMNSTIKNGFKLLTATTALGGICCFAAFCFKSTYGFLVFFVLGQLFLFGAQGPVNFIYLHSVKPSLRPISLAISTIAIHILGDVPSSPLVGYLQDHIHKWRTTALILTSIFAVAAAIWLIGIFLHSVDRYNEEDNASTITDPVAA
ncbi:hypothetical protein MKW92_022696 [Papaver armeniacum]|nr:hypothetical protein MKW92_022696 [Papaver armeniacum]